MLLNQPYTLHTNNQTYTIVGKNVNIPIYTERSIEREVTILSHKIEKFNSKKNYLFIWCAPYCNKIYKKLSLKNQEKLIWFSPTYVEEPVSNRIIYNNQSLDFFVNSIEKQIVFTIAIHPYLKNKTLGNLLYNYTQDIIRNIARRIKTIQNFHKIWEYNHRRNIQFYNQNNILFAKKKHYFQKPDAIICGGKSIDNKWDKIRKHMTIWCADTALPALLFYKIQPNLVFSIDAGKGSIEHFITASNNKNIIKKIRVVLDCLSFPQLYEFPFKKIYTYKSTNPLLETTPILKKAETISNKKGDILGLMIAIYEKLFSTKYSLPIIYGNDNNQHFHYITHLRGSSYYQYQNYRNNRLHTLEKYFYCMSKKYQN